MDAIAGRSHAWATFVSATLIVNLFFVAAVVVSLFSSTYSADQDMLLRQKR